MADVQNEPPIILHPDVDKAQTTTFINENFRKISDAVNTYISNNTFNIVASGNATVTAPSVNTNNSVATSSQNTVVAHNLGYIPAALVYSSFSNGAIPFSNMGVTTGTLNNWNFVNQYFQVDATNITFINVITASSTGSVSNNGLGMTVTYYLLKETAN